MLLRCSVLLFCLTAICAQKGGRQAAESVERPIQRSPSQLLAGRKIPQASEPIQQVQEPEDRDPEEDREVVFAAKPQRPRLPPPPPSRPQPTESESHDPAPEPYSFSYSVDDPETGAASSREETQDANGEIVGFYHIRDADGRSRRVDYTAGKDGFKANIKSNEEGVNAREPADVKMEVSASENRATYAPNNRPAASINSLKSYGALPVQPFYQNLIPAAFATLPAPIAPLPAPSAPAPLPAPPAESQRIEQIVQKAEDPPEEAQISQTYETSEASDPQEIVQQRNVDEEEAFGESSPPTPAPPVKGGPVTLVPPPPRTEFRSPAPIPVQQYQPVQPVVQYQPIQTVEQYQPVQTVQQYQPVQTVQQYQPVQTVQQYQPAQRQIGQFTPSIIQSFREQGVVSPQQILTPITQVREEIQNTIQEPQPPASTKNIPSPPVPPPVTYQAYQPQYQAPILSSPSIPFRQPIPSVTPQLIQFHQRGQAVNAVRQTVPNLAPLSPPSNNIVFQQREHRAPLSQEKLLDYFQPIPNIQFNQAREITIAPQAPRPISLPAPQYYPVPLQWSAPVEQVQQQVVQPKPQPIAQPINSGYTLVVNHREAQLTQPKPQQVITQERINVEPPQQIEQRSEVRVSELVPPPQPQALSSINVPVTPQYQYNPLPSPPTQALQRQAQFEPQQYEPLQQTYEPLQQEAEDPAEESRATPPCECAKQAASIPQPIKSLSAPEAPSEPQPVKSNRLVSPARAFIPQAFRSS